MAAKQSKSVELAEKIMNAKSGRAGIRINGQIVQWDSDKKKKLCIGDREIPAARLVEHLTGHEVDELNNLPRWDGSNEFQINSACLHLVGAAIDRYEGVPATLSEEAAADQRERLQRCYCTDCIRSHQD